MTHALQFGGVPWLRPHLAEMLRELLGALEFDPRGLLRVPDCHRSREARRARARGRAGDDRRRRRPARAARPPAGVHGRARGLRRARDGRGRRRACSTTCPGCAPRSERRRSDRSGLLQLLDRLIGHGPQAAPVRAGQGVLRRRRRARAGSRASTASGAGLRRCRRSPSSSDPLGWLRAHRAAPAAPVRLIEPAF